mmetsp:Transcript_35360/g.70761  ORF Transcript_35360/g.70761 Transcript_35360/m.70761 type:complete len:275 (-) Transcript_35360:477-1301(-)
MLLCSSAALDENAANARDEACTVLPELPPSSTPTSASSECAPSACPATTVFPTSAGCPAPRRARPTSRLPKMTLALSLVRELEMHTPSEPLPLTRFDRSSTLPASSTRTPASPLSATVLYDSEHTALWMARTPAPRAPEMVLWEARSCAWLRSRMLHSLLSRTVFRRSVAAAPACILSPMAPLTSSLSENDPALWSCITTLPVLCPATVQRSMTALDSSCISSPARCWASVLAWILHPVARSAACSHAHSPALRLFSMVQDWTSVRLLPCSSTP